MSLAGRHVVITRPEGQAAGICQALNEQGAIPVLFPLLGIAPIDDASHLRSVVKQLDGFDLAFFVSPNAVRYACDAVFSLRNWPAALPVATVGRASENALYERGFDYVIAPSSGFDTESVLALPEFAPKAIRGKRVVIFRGDGGRELLGNYLGEQGASVEYVSVYHRYCPQTNASQLLELADKGELDAMILTSSEGVRHLGKLLEGCAAAGVFNAAVFAPHPRIAGFCRDIGFRNIVLTAAGDDGLLDGLNAYFATPG